MKIGTLGEKNHADSKYDSQFALKAIPDYEPLNIKKNIFCSLLYRRSWSIIMSLSKS